MKEKKEKHIRRRKRVRAKVFGKEARLRLSVYRSKKHIYAQVIDDEKSKTLVSANDLEMVSKKQKNTGKVRSKKIVKSKSAKSKKILEQSLDLKKYSKIGLAGLVGELLAKKALMKKIKKVVFDRSGYKYHGRVKALAEGARKGGLLF